MLINAGPIVTYKNAFLKDIVINLCCNLEY